MTKKQKFMIVDGNAILHRAWHALPPMMTKDGLVVHAAYGFISTFFKALKELKPDFVAVTFDRKEKTFRHEQSVDYKATRVKQPDELYAQIPIVKEVLEALNVKIFEKAGFEADDVIGTLCHSRQVDNPNVQSIIVTGDMDALQLVDDNTEVFTLRKGMSDTVVYNEQAVKEKYDGLRPDQLVDYKGLRGDPSDNISGVPGIGEKTALGLMKQFGSIDKMYGELEGKRYSEIKIERYKEIKLTERLFNLLIDNKDKAMQSRMLSEIVRNVDIDFDLQECALRPYDKAKTFEIFQKYAFKSLLGRLPDFGGGDEQDKRDNLTAREDALDAQCDYKHVVDEKSFEEFFEKIKQQEEFCFDTETDSLDVFEAKLLGVSFCWRKGSGYYVSLRGAATNTSAPQPDNWLEKLKPLFEDEKIKKIGHNLKFDVKILKMQGIEVRGLYFDTMVASYVLNPGTRAHSLDDLAFRELGHQMIKFHDLVGKGAGQISMAMVDGKKLSNYSCEDADYTWQLYKHFKPVLEKDKLWKLFEEIEMPLIEVLVEMEMNGIKIDVKQLEKLSKKVNDKIDLLTSEIYKLAGEEFNINSPLQMKKILFEKLKIDGSGLAKTKTGISTGAPELEKLSDWLKENDESKDKIELIDFILEYRELAKLKSTYIDALPAIVNKKTGRVHTDFNQTVAATGRLSSSNPNLQNIPARTELGKEIRKAFIAEKGNKLVSADYSQIELRVIACLSGDKNMMEVFKKNEDIHRATAAKIFQVPLEEVSDDQRQAAKEVNFGVLYGMGAWGLASRKKISREQAADFIKKYFENFSDVKKYIDKMKEDAADKGYVETMFGRRRYLPEINSGVQQVRAGAERMAINMPIQGTAADLIKIAMIAVYQEIKKSKNQEIKGTKILLQVHDELVFEVPEEMVDLVAKMIDEKMEKIHKLCVPIKVDTEVGDNWLEMDSVA